MQSVAHWMQILLWHHHSVSIGYRPRFAVMMLALPCGDDEDRITICENGQIRLVWNILNISIENYIEKPFKAELTSAGNSSPSLMSTMSPTSICSNLSKSVCKVGTTKSPNKCRKIQNLCSNLRNSSETVIIFAFSLQHLSQCAGSDFEPPDF